MTTSLIPERAIVVSPSLATSIGLEEAILLQHIETAIQLGDTRQRADYQWGRTSLQRLSQQLPFWSSSAVRRILHNLMDLGLVLIDDFPRDENHTIEIAINQKSSPILQADATTPHTQHSTPLGAHRIPQTRQPDRSVIEQLIQQGTSIDFINDAVAEFVIYWRDRNEASHSW